jgi:hypothetical protein
MLTTGMFWLSIGTKDPVSLGEAPPNAPLGYWTPPESFKRIFAMMKALFVFCQTSPQCRKMSFALQDKNHRSDHMEIGLIQINLLIKEIILFSKNRYI